jgi:hypothetical protein
MLGRVQKSNSVFILCPIEIVINWRYPGFSMSHLLPERLEGAWSSCRSLWHFVPSYGPMIKWI